MNPSSNKLKRPRFQEGISFHEGHHHNDSGGSLHPNVDGDQVMCIFNSEQLDIPSNP
ncbi:hypothetical protein A2U01_0039565, partial [Trifolium medium]|nr:hypothetical protein [Trifolium medium]